MFSKLKSRKLWATVAGASIMAFGGSMGISDEVTAKIAMLIGAYIAGQSLVDATAKN